MSVLDALGAAGESAAAAPEAVAAVPAAGTTKPEVLRGQNGGCSHVTACHGNDRERENVAAGGLPGQKEGCRHRTTTHGDDGERENMVPQNRENGYRLESPEPLCARTATADCSVLHGASRCSAAAATLPTGFTGRASVDYTGAVAPPTAAAMEERATPAPPENTSAFTGGRAMASTPASDTATVARQAAGAGSPFPCTLGERKQAASVQCHQRETTDCKAVALPAEATDMNFCRCQVAVKVRPFTLQELAAKQEMCISWEGRRLHVLPPINRAYTVDYVFPPESSRTEFFNTCVMPLMRAFLSGYNATIIAYGQTGTGKTYMMGSYSNAAVRHSDIIDPALRLCPAGATAATVPRPSPCAAEETKCQDSEGAENRDSCGILQLASYFLFRALEERKRESLKRSASAAANIHQVEGTAAIANSGVHGTPTAELQSEERKPTAEESTPAAAVSGKGAAAVRGTEASEEELVAGGTTEQQKCSPAGLEAQQHLVEAEVSCSYMELYNEEIRDLLDGGDQTWGKGSAAVPGAAAGAGVAKGGHPAGVVGGRKKRYVLKENPITKQISVQGLTQHIVTSAEELLSCVARGSTARATVFTITLRQRWSQLLREEENGQQQQQQHRDESVEDRSHRKSVRDAAATPRAGEEASGSKLLCKEEESEEAGPQEAAQATTEERVAATGASLPTEVAAIGSSVTSAEGEGAQFAVVTPGDGPIKDAVAGKTETATAAEHRKATPVAAARQKAQVITSKIHFVDLAGSERVKRTQADGQRLREGISVNMGLLALSNVICALAARRDTVQGVSTTRSEAASLAVRRAATAFCSPSRFSRAASVTGARGRVSLAGGETAGESGDAETAVETSAARARALRHCRVWSAGAWITAGSDGEATLSCLSRRHASWRGLCLPAGSTGLRQGMGKMVFNDGPGAAPQLAQQSTTEANDFACTFLSLRSSGSAAAGGGQQMSREEISRLNQAPFSFAKNAICPYSSATGEGGRRGWQHQYIPYRASKLTRILQDSLGGDSKTLMLVCVSPAAADCHETYRTMHYASRTMGIRNRPVVQQDPTAVLIQNLMRQVMLLQRQASATRGAAAALDAIDWKQRCVLAEAAAAEAAKENRLLRQQLQTAQAQLKRLMELKENRGIEGSGLSDISSDEEEDGNDDEAESNDEVDNYLQLQHPRQYVAMEAPHAGSELHFTQEMQHEGAVQEQAEEQAEGRDEEQQQAKHQGQHQNGNDQVEKMKHEQKEHRELNRCVREPERWQQPKEQRGQQQQEGPHQEWSLRHEENCQELVRYEVERQEPHEKQKKQRLQEQQQKQGQLGQPQHDPQEQHILLHEVQQQPAPQQRQVQAPQQQHHLKRYHEGNLLQNQKVGHQIQREDDDKALEGQQRRKAHYQQQQQLQERQLQPEGNRQHALLWGECEQHQRKTQEQGGQTRQVRNQQHNMQHNLEVLHDMHRKGKEQHQVQPRQQLSGQQQQQGKQEQQGQLPYVLQIKDKENRRDGVHQGEEHPELEHLDQDTQRRHELQIIEEQHRLQEWNHGEWRQQGEQNEDVKIQQDSQKQQDLLQDGQAQQPRQPRGEQRGQQEGQQHQGQGLPQDQQLLDEQYWEGEALQLEGAERLQKARLQQDQEMEHRLHQEQHRQDGPQQQHEHLPQEEQQQQQQYEQCPQREQQQQQQEKHPQRVQRQYLMHGQREQQQHEQYSRRRRDQHQHERHPRREQQEHPQRVQQQCNQHSQREQHKHEQQLQNKQQQKRGQQPQHKQEQQWDQQQYELQQEKVQHQEQHPQQDHQQEQGQPQEHGSQQKQGPQQHQNHPEDETEENMHGEHQTLHVQHCEDEYQRQKEQRRRQRRHQQQELQEKEATGKPRRQHLLVKVKQRSAEAKQRRPSRQAQEKHKQQQKQQGVQLLQPAQPQHRQQRQQQFLLPKRRQTQQQRPSSYEEQQQLLPKQRQTQQQRPSSYLYESRKNAELLRRQTRRLRRNPNKSLAKFFAEDIDSLSPCRYEAQDNPEPGQTEAEWESEEEVRQQTWNSKPVLWVINDTKGGAIKAVVLELMEDDVESQQEPAVAPDTEDEMHVSTLGIAKPESVTVPAPILARSPPASETLSRTSRSSMSSISGGGYGSWMMQRHNSFVSSISIKRPSSVSVATWSSRSTIDTESVASNKSNESNNNPICPPLTNFLFPCTQMAGCGVVSTTESEASPRTSVRRRAPHTTGSSHNHRKNSSRVHRRNRHKRSKRHSDSRSIKNSFTHDSQSHNGHNHCSHDHDTHSHYSLGHYGQNHDIDLDSARQGQMDSRSKSVANDYCKRGSTEYATALRKLSACAQVPTSLQTNISTLAAAAASIASPRKYIRASSNSTISSLTSSCNRYAQSWSSNGYSAVAAASDGSSHNSLPVWHETDERQDGCLLVERGDESHRSNTEGGSTTTPAW